MTEEEVIKKTTGSPATVDSLATDLVSLGLSSGMTLIVHSSLSSLGWVCGGAPAAILALEKVIGPEGTLVMPTHSTDLSDPVEWQSVQIPESWQETVRQNLPAYDPALTPTWGVGAIPECFRKQAGVVRSGHPHVSFAAWGAKAEAVVAAHSLDYSLSEGSPIARLYELGGWVLLLGVGHNKNTSLHLAEYRANFAGKKPIRTSAPVMKDGQRVWAEFSDIALDESDFPLLGEAFAQETGLVRKGLVAQAQAWLMPQRPLVDFGVRWMEKNRGRSSVSAALPSRQRALVVVK